MALINLRNALMAGRRLPYDAEVEYLESTGTQYIDVDASKVATASRYVCYGQYMASSNQAMMWSHGYRGIRSYGGRIGFVTGKYATTNTTVIYNTGCIIDFDAVSLKGILTSPSGTELANVTIGSSSASGGLRIFAASETATGYLASQSRLYFMRVYDAAGNILFDFIPVRKGTVGYLYDRVSGKLFGNAGTGDFVRGPDVVPVEYIESTGTQWIDTGLIGRDGYDFEYRFRPMSPLPCGIGGEYQSKKSCYIGLVRSNSNLAYNYYFPDDIVEVQSLTLGIDYNVKAHLYSGWQYFEVNGVRGGASSRTGTFTSSYNLYLFAINSANQPANLGTMRLYNLTVHLNTIPIRSFRPVRVGSGSTWEGAMMDVLTRRIYRNAGTGAFGYGNDLKYPIPA